MSKYPSDPKPFGNPQDTDEVKIRGDAKLDLLIGHQDFCGKYSGQIIFEMRTKTPLHSGSGLYDLLNDRPVRSLAKMPDGTPFVPGTSIKGAVRSVVEAISNSCVRIVNKDIEKALSKNVKPCDEIKHDNDKRRLCVACRIFGGLGYQGRVSFSDALLVDKYQSSTHKVLHPHAPSKDALHYKDASNKFYRRKFYFNGEVEEAKQKTETYETIGKGKTLDFIMDFENLSSEELCLILTAMGVLTPFRFKIGGAKFVLLGTVIIKPVILDMREPQKEFQDWDYEPQPYTEDEKIILDWLNEEIGGKTDLIIQESLDGLRQMWEPSETHTAPKQAY